MDKRAVEMSARPKARRLRGTVDEIYNDERRRIPADVVVPSDEEVRAAALRALVSLIMFEPYQDEPRRRLRIGGSKSDAQQFGMMLVDAAPMTPQVIHASSNPHCRGPGSRAQMRIMVALGLGHSEFLKALVDLCRGETIDWSPGKAVA